MCVALACLIYGHFNLIYVCVCMRVCILLYVFLFINPINQSINIFITRHGTGIL